MSDQTFSLSYAELKHRAEKAESELVQEREWRISETAASNAMQVRAESAERELDALKLKLGVVKNFILEQIDQVLLH